MDEGGAQADPLRVIDGLIDLIEGWQHGVFERLGVTWQNDPPALIAAREYRTHMAGSLFSVVPPVGPQGRAEGSPGRIGEIDDSVEHAWNTLPVQVVVDVDAGVATLVEALNEVPGCRTYVSCEGHPHSPTETRAYVGIGYRPSNDELPAQDPKLADELQQMFVARLMSWISASMGVSHGVPYAASNDAGWRLWIDAEQVLKVAGAVRDFARVERLRLGWPVPESAFRQGRYSAQAEHSSQDGND